MFIPYLQDKKKTDKNFGVCKMFRTCKLFAPFSHGIYSDSEYTPCLSPVRTHILIPPSARFAMVSGTPSCSLSSMAVAPISIISCSISLVAFIYFFIPVNQRCTAENKYYSTDINKNI